MANTKGLVLLGGIVLSQYLGIHAGEGLAAESGSGSLRLQLGLSLSIAAESATAHQATPVAPMRSFLPSELAERAISALPTVAAADARLRIDSERLEQSRGALRPNATGTLGYREELANAGSTAPFSTLSGRLQVALPLYRPQATAVIDQAQYQENASRSALSEARLDALTRTMDAFLLATQADEEINLLEQERAVLLAQRNLNQRRIDGGVGTRVDLMETAARSDSILAQIESARAVHASQLSELSRLVRSTVAAVSRMQDRLPPLYVPARVEDAIALARSRNRQVARLESTLLSARSGVDVQRSGLKPTVDLIGNLDQSRTLFSGSASSSPSAALGVQMAIPLYTGGVGGARVREQQAQVDLAQAQLEDALLAVAAELRKAYFDLSRTSEQWRIQNDILSTANESLAATRKAFEAGARSNVDLLNSQQLTFSTRREAIRARVGAFAAQVRILALAGLLDVEMLQRTDGAFSPDSTAVEIK